MSSEIIQFPKARSIAVQSNWKEAGDGPEKSRQELVQSVRKAAEDPKRKFEGDDEIWPARAVDELTASAKKHKITQNDLRSALAEKEIKISHLDRLRVDHAVRPEEAKKDLKYISLVRKIQPYVHVLEVLAEILGYDKDDEIFKAFKDTKFARHAVASADDPATELNWLLHEMVGYIVRTEGVKDYFGRVRTISGRYDAIIGDFVQGRQLLGAGGFEGHAEVSWCQFPLPAVPLIRLSRATFSGPLLVERHTIGTSDLGAAEIAQVISPSRHEPPEPFGHASTVAAELRISSDLRLVIGPTRRPEEIGPLFECRSYVELLTEGLVRPLTFPLSITPLGTPNQDYPHEFANFVGSVAALFGDGWHRVTGVSPQDWNGLAELAPGFGSTIDQGPCFDPAIGDMQGIQEFAVYWEPVSGSTVKQFMQLLSQPPWERRWSWLSDLTRSKAPPTEFRYVEQGCQDFETALFTATLEETLSAACRELTTKLNMRIANAKMVRERETAAMRARWQSSPQNRETPSNE